MAKKRKAQNIGYTPEQIATQKAYSKERKRINQFIRRATKRGYVFPENVVPAKPQTISEGSVKALQRITTDSLYRKATYIDSSSGKKVPGVIGRKYERSRASKKAAATRAGKGIIADPIPDFSKLVLANVREEIDRWSPYPNWTPYFTQLKENDKNIVASALDGAIAQDGEKAVALRLEQHATEVNSLLQEILYGSGGKEGRSQVNFDLTRFSSIIMGRALTIEESKKLTELAETMELEN